MEFAKHRFNYRKDILVKRGEDVTKTEIQIMNNLGIIGYLIVGLLDGNLNQMSNF